MSDISEKEKMRKEIRDKQTKERREAKEKVREIFTRRMIELRKEKGVSKKEASSEMKISVNALRNYEAKWQDNKLPDIIELIKIKKYYNVSYEYLLEEDGKRNYDTDEQAIKNKKALNDIKKILTNLNN